MSEFKLTSEITVRPIQQMGGDHMVVAAAKVSTCGEDALRWAEPDNDADSKGLIRYLMKNRHGTPFEHSSLTFFVHAPIFVFREWHRHRIGQSYNEESARYKQLDPVFWVPRIDRRMIPAPEHKSAKPSFMTLRSWVADSHPEITVADLDEQTADAHQAIRDCMESGYRSAYAHYEALMRKHGIAKEVARAVLPVGIYSSMWVTLNPRSLMAFLSLRTSDSAATFPSRPQAEIEEAARACERAFECGWPVTHAAFNEFGRVAP